MQAIYCILLSYVLMYMARSTRPDCKAIRGFFALMSYVALIISVIVAMATGITGR